MAPMTEGIVLILIILQGLRLQNTSASCIEGHVIRLRTWFLVPTPTTKNSLIGILGILLINPTFSWTRAYTICCENNVTPHWCHIIPHL